MCRPWAMDQGYQPTSIDVVNIGRHLWFTRSVFPFVKLNKWVSVQTKQCRRCLTSHLNRNNGHAPICCCFVIIRIEAGDTRIILAVTHFEFCGWMFTKLSGRDHCIFCSWKGTACTAVQITCTTFTKGKTNLANHGVILRVYNTHAMSRLLPLYGTRIKVYTLWLMNFLCDISS